MWQGTGTMWRKGAGVACSYKYSIASKTLRTKRTLTWWTIYEFFTDWFPQSTRKSTIKDPKLGTHQATFLFLSLCFLRRFRSTSLGLFVLVCYYLINYCGSCSCQKAGRMPCFIDICDHVTIFHLLGSKYIYDNFSKLINGILINAMNKLAPNFLHFSCKIYFCFYCLHTASKTLWLKGKICASLGS